MHPFQTYLRNAIIGATNGLAAGGLIGFGVAVLTKPADADRVDNIFFGLVVVLGLIVGAIAGIIIALVQTRRALHRAKQNAPSAAPPPQDEHTWPPPPTP